MSKFAVQRSIPLISAVEEGKLGRVKQLLPKSDINAKNESGFTALMLAIKLGFTSIVDFLLSNGADVEIKNAAGQTALFLASWFNQEEVTRALIAKKADLNAGDSRGWTPLMISVYHSHVEIVKLLLNAGANKEAKDCFGKTPLDRCKGQEIKELLVEKPKKPAEKTNKKPTMQRSQSANRLTTRAPKENIGKFKEELDRHIQASTLTLASKAADQCLENIRKATNSELHKAYELLHQEAHQSLVEDLTRIYNNLGAKLVGMVDQSCLEKGLTLPHDPFQVPTLQVEIQPKRGAPKLKSGTYGRVYERLSKMGSSIPSLAKMPGEDLKELLVAQIDNYVEHYASQLDIISNEQISKDISDKVMQLTQFITQEMNNNLSYLSAQLMEELQRLIELRFQQIMDVNTGREPEANPEDRVISAPPPRMPRINLEHLKNL